MKCISTKPLLNSFKVQDNFWAGEYPGAKNENEAKEKLSGLVDFGINVYVDLTEEGELTPYAQLLPAGTCYYRFPIEDVNVPSDVAEVKFLLDKIDSHLNSGDRVYLHCWGGVGRTGTVIACWFCYKYGMSPEDSIKRLREAFLECPKSSSRNIPETAGQVRFITSFYDWFRNPLSKNAIPQAEIIRDRIRGSLIGGAAGDQLGYPVEFKSYDGIVLRYGEKGVTRYSGEKVISDDTQMTLFTACGLLNSVKEGIEQKLGVCRAYIEWYRTQIGKGHSLLNECWITSIPELNVNRAPGTTCMGALENIANGREPVNNSKGCGGVMRIAPVALYGAAVGGDIDSYDKLAGDAAEITHQHPLGFIPAAFMSHLIFRLVSDRRATRDAMLMYVGEALCEIEKLYSMYKPDVEKFRILIEKAVNLSSDTRPDYECIREIGEGWTGDEAVAIAVYCCLRHFDDFEAALVAAVNHDGDSDSTGAVTGNILGAAIGYDAIPEFFKTDLELHDVIMHIADDLCRGKTTEFVPKMKTEKI